MQRAVRGVALLAALGLSAGCGGGAATGGGAGGKSPAQLGKMKMPTDPAARIGKSYAGPKMRVAVGEFKELEATAALFQELGWPGVGPLITEQITAGLVHSGRVAVLERGQIGTVIGNTQLEQEGNLAGYFDQKTTVEKGKLEGAQAVLVGAVTRFEPDVEGMKASVNMALLGDLDAHTEKALVSIEVRLVNQETGRVMAAASGTGEMTTTEAGVDGGYKGVSLTAKSWSRTPLGAATRQAAESAIAELVQGIAETPWEGSVINVKGPDKVFIDAGGELNLKKGDRFRVVHRGEAITGSDGQVMGYDETEGGWLELTSVQQKMSIGRMVEGDPPEAGDLIRLPATSPAK